MIDRTVNKTVKGRKTVDGAGVHLVRVIGYNDVKAFDPFLMLDAFDSKNPEDYVAGFPFHPHRGIETVTYLISGDIEHRDSLGNQGEIGGGACQWMTAGSGIMHQEMPRAAEHLLGLQLWVNLPAKDKMAPPKYRNLTPEMIPVVRTDEAVVRVLSGRYKGQRGAMEGDYVRATYLDVELPPDGHWNVETEPMDTAFFYIVLGSVAVKGGGQLTAKQAVLLSHGDVINFTAGPEGARFVLLVGAPLKEPVAWGGPIVMNTEDELRAAFYELEADSFIKENGRSGGNP